MNRKLQNDPIRLGVLPLGRRTREFRIFFLRRDPYSVRHKPDQPHRYDRHYGVLVPEGNPVDFVAHDLEGVRCYTARWHERFAKAGFATVPGFIWVGGLLTRATSPFPEPVPEVVPAVEAAEVSIVARRRSMVRLREVHLQLVSSLEDPRLMQRSQRRPVVRSRVHAARQPALGPRRRHSRRNR